MPTSPSERSRIELPTGGQRPVISPEEFEALRAAQQSSADLIARLRRREMERAGVIEEEPLPDPVPIHRPLPQLEHAQTNEALKWSAHIIYQASVSYHVTNAASKQDIQRYGFQLGRKTAGALAKSGGFYDPQSSSYHYLMGSREQAKAFGDRHLRGQATAIVRVLGAGHAFPIETDPRSSEMYKGYRTRSDIGPELVLGPKGRPAGEDADGFRRLLGDAGLEVDTAHAGQLLRYVQSDSEDDLSEDFYD